MKKSIFKKSFLAATVVAAMTFGFASCSDDDDKDDNKTPDEEIVLDGFYFKGDGSALTTLNAKGQLKSTKNEVGQEDRAELKEIYVAIKANSTFNLIEVKGASRTTYGPGEGFGAVESEDLDKDEPQFGLQRGAIVDTDATFKVTEDGLYHVVYDTELKVGSIAKVEWGVIGAATANGWSGSTQLQAKFDFEKMEFKNVEAAGLALRKGDLKFRYSHGWKVLLSEEPEVNVNTNFGGTFDALVAGGDNMINSNGGLYALTLTWELGKDYVVSLEKIGDLDIKDYSAYELGIIGNAYNNAEGEPEAWKVNYPGSTKAPKVDGNVYTWEYLGLNLFAGNFKFRQGEDWDGMSVGFNDVVIEGNAADILDVDGDGNFVFNGEEGIYDIVLVIDAEIDTYTFTINKK